MHMNILGEYNDLQSIETGTKIIIEVRGFNEVTYKVGEVTNVTKTQFATSTGHRFMKENGVEHGYTNRPWDSNVRVCLYTETAWDKAQRRLCEQKQSEALRALQYQIAGQEWQTVNPAQLVKIAKVLDIEHDVDLESEDA